MTPHRYWKTGPTEVIQVCGFLKRIVAESLSSLATGVYSFGALNLLILFTLRKTRDAKSLTVGERHYCSND